MAFIKTGDAQPIQAIYTDEGDVSTCPVCKSPKTVVAFNENGEMTATCECSVSLDDDTE